MASSNSSSASAAMMMMDTNPPTLHTTPAELAEMQTLNEPTTIAATVTLPLSESPREGSLTSSPSSLSSSMSSLSSSGSQLVSPGSSLRPANTIRNNNDEPFQDPSTPPLTSTLPTTTLVPTHPTSTSHPHSHPHSHATPKVKKETKLMTAEERGEGAVGWAVYRSYLLAANRPTMILAMFVSFFLGNGLGYPTTNAPYQRTPPPVPLTRPIITNAANHRITTLSSPYH